MDEAAVRKRVRQMIDTGALPCEDEEKMWAGRGVGRLCMACTEPIAPTEVEFEVELGSGQTLRLHRDCHRIWTEECAPGVR
jgi:hypothetical protein